ncbi:hypothetical protein RD110_15825 [Rhodoferax koreense]|uniref:Morphogenetic protein n=1 Tax=Rhodoferax koreensis TaxID=1842727 RepID=A0A1P8JXK6_9BURK|nr:hypothetical protein [Rhodoferax koreense]APW38490.1 hypothetical protein RD110_15825 [Rhodoferax koreense]
MNAVTQPRERPILFQGDMVRAILAGAKRQTRRVFKQATGPSLSVGMDDDAPGVAELSWLWGDGPGHDVHETIARIPCPYGRPGDLLWVRESWAPDPVDDGSWNYTSWAGCRDGKIAGVPERFRNPLHVIYAADWKGQPHRWTPSIHMPRWASRMLLEITEVRVERLGDISEEDAKAEGIIPHIRGGWHWREHNPHDLDDWDQLGFKTAREAYRALWESINGYGSWNLNPWVWAVSFEVIKP